MKMELWQYCLKVAAIVVGTFFALALVAMLWVLHHHALAVEREFPWPK